MAPEQRGLFLIFGFQSAASVLVFFRLTRLNLSLPEEKGPCKCSADVSSAALLVSMAESFCMASHRCKLPSASRPLAAISVCRRGQVVAFTGAYFLPVFVMRNRQGPSWPLADLDSLAKLHTSTARLCQACRRGEQRGWKFMEHKLKDARW